MAADTSADVDLNQRRYDAGKNTVAQTISLGYRLQVICLACDRRPVVDLHRLAARGFAQYVLRDLPFTCTYCRDKRRKMSIHPAGKDTCLRVLFQGEQPTERPPA